MKPAVSIVAALNLACVLALSGSATAVSPDSTHIEQGVDQILEKLEQNQQEIKTYLSLIAEKLNVTFNITVEEEIFAENSTESATEQTLEPEEIIKLEEPEVITEPPALDLSTLETIQATYPRCSKTSNLVEDGRLNRVLSLVSSPRFSHLSQPALFNAILDSILTPSPLVCTQDYVRLAYKVQRNKKSSGSSLVNNKEEWAWLKGRFQPRVFDLFEAKAWKIMSVGKPGFGLFATNVELPGVPEYSCVVVKRSYDNSNAVRFKFSSSKTDGANFRVVSVLTGTSYQLLHMCRSIDCDETDSKLLILPTTEFVLGNNSTAPLEFRIAQVSFARMAAVAGHGDGFWGLPFTMRMGTYTFREAGVSLADESSNFLFYLV